MIVTVTDQEVQLTDEEYTVFIEMKKHPLFHDMLHDLATDPERKVKKLIKMWEFIKVQCEETNSRKHF